MAGSLIKIQETTVSSAVASVTLTGIDSTYDVYQFIISGLEIFFKDLHIAKSSISSKFGKPFICSKTSFFIKIPWSPVA